MIILKTIWTERKRIAKERLNVCSSCPEYKDDKCSKCGCLMEIKAYFPNSDCPLGKWKSYQEE